MPMFVVELDIPATPERVWDVLTDFSAYPEWNPLQTIEGHAELFAGLKIRTRKSEAGTVPPATRAIIWKIRAPEKLEFLSGRPFLDSTKRFFHLAPHQGGTRLRHGIVFSGAVSRWNFSHGHKLDRLEPMYRLFGDALIRRAKSSRSSPSTSGNRRTRRAAQANTKSGKGANG